MVAVLLKHAGLQRNYKQTHGPNNRGRIESHESQTPFRLDRGEDRIHVGACRPSHGSDSGGCDTGQYRPQRMFGVSAPWHFHY
jgi:hypothetical protein